MTKLAAALFTGLSLCALPALAQTTPAPVPAPNTTPMSFQQAQQKIKQDLTTDGYTDVNVMPNSFLVHAKDKRGENVVMIINPDSVFAVTQLPQHGQASGQANGQATATTKP